MPRTLTHFIGGREVPAAATLESLNPSDTREVVALYPDGGAQDVEAAVAAARVAFPGWAGASPEARADVLDRAGDLILQRREDLGHDIPSREIIENYVREVHRVLRPGALFKFQVQGAPVESEKDHSWVGEWFTERQAHEMADRCGFELRHQYGVGDQYYWLWYFKR